MSTFRPIEGNMNVKAFFWITIAVLYIALPLFVIGLLCVQNRSSELLVSKIALAIVAALFAILSALLFSLKSENKELKFSSTVFFHKLDKRPLDDYLRGDGGLRFGGRQFRGKLSAFISNRLEECEYLNKTEFNKDGQKIVEFYHSVLLIELIDQFFWMYSARWDTNVYSVRRGTATLKESLADSDDRPPNYDCLNWRNLLSTGQQGNFCDLLSAFSNIDETKVPPKTTVALIITEREKGIILKNPFVEVTISIEDSGESNGLGDFKWLLGYDNKKNEEFYSAHFRINCSAAFRKYRSGDPKMPKYKQWVDAMFGEVQYLLDEKEQLKRAHEYRDLIKR